MEKQLVKDKSIMFASKESKCHWVQCKPDVQEYLKIWIKDPTFLELEQAQTKLFELNMQGGDVSLNLADLYRYLFETFIEKTEPNLSVIDLIRLTPFVGNQIKELMPSPFTALEESEERKN